MKPQLEQKFIRASEFKEKGLEVKTRFFYPNNRNDAKDVPNYLVVGRGKERYILQRTVPLSLLEENGAMYHVMIFVMFIISLRVLFHDKVREIWRKNQKDKKW